MPNGRQLLGWLQSIVIGVALGGAVAFGAERVLSPGGAQTLPFHHAADASIRTWIRNGRPSPEAFEFLTLLRKAGTEGLDPSRYQVVRIERDLALPGDRAALARADRLLSDAYLSYARDMRVPRTSSNTTYIDAELAPSPVDARDFLASRDPVAKLRRLQGMNPIYNALRAGLEWYRREWSNLPQVRIPAGEPLRLGSRSARVALLRRRLGLPPPTARSDVFDAQLGKAVARFREIHGLEALPVADAATIDALNLGAAHYERLIAANLDRVRGLPIDGRRYILVDAAGAELRMIEGGRQVDAMRVIVGKPAMPTPQLAGLIRFAIVNPYWNIPPDLVQHSVAPQVLREGPGYLAQRKYALFSDWTPAARTLEPAEVDWNEIAAGRQKVWIRQLPGGENMMGKVKFMLPNRLGIYLHDTPRKSDFLRADRHLSSGCVRLEDAQRLARWIFKDREVIDGDTTPEKRVDIPNPVPVYITYLTAVPRQGEVRFRKDLYGRDRKLTELLKPPV